MIEKADKLSFPAMPEAYSPDTGSGAPTRSATIPIRFVAELARHLGERAGAVADSIERAGIAPALLTQESARVTVEQFAAFYRSLAIELDDETPGLFASPLRAGTLKFLCLGLLDAPNLRVALHRYCQFFRLLLDDLRFELASSGSVAQIRLIERRDLGAVRVLALELMLMLVQGIASWMLDRKILFNRIELAYPAPAYAGEYIHLYTGPAQFGCAVTALSLDAAYLDAPIRQDKRALSAFLKRAPMDWIHVSVGERFVTHRVRDLLDARLGQAQTVESIAHALHMSPRTLARRLQAEGTHFQAVKDGLLRDAAIARLSRTAEAIGAIGADLGFEDPAAFNRAFRRWTGTPPGSYRRRLALPA